NRAEATVLDGLPTGWRNGRLPPQRVALTQGERGVEVRYQSRRDGSFTVGDTGSATVHGWWPTGIDVEVDGRRLLAAVTRAGGRLHVQTGRGTVDLDVVPRFVVPGAVATTGGLVAPMPGVVLDVRCAVGDLVRARQTLVVLEAMKMEHHVNAPADGVVAEVRVAKGQQVDNGAVLLVIDPAEAEAGT
ncbi:MAG: biotin/lipoyl-binding protein, partial [Actinomycetota bacterium]|nr:biotin/lipoyl-binding protein [Actinomycetota bacterium]